MSLRRSARNKKDGLEENEIKKPDLYHKKKIDKIGKDKQENEESPKKKSKTSNKVDQQYEDQNCEISENTEWQNAKSIYDFKVRDINGQEVSLSKYQEHVCIIVNVASRCGHTKSNYEQFVELYDNFSKEKGLRILAFPCNQFGKQEPGDSEKICEFAKKRNVQFDLFEKIEVNGQNANPLWKYLTSRIEGPKGKKIDWNFTKFIIDKEGQVVERHKPSVKPLQMIEFLEKYWS